MAYKIDRYGVEYIKIDTEEEKALINTDLFPLSTKVYVIETKKWYILNGNKEWKEYL